MKHIFPTGQIKIGKSTVICKALSRLNVPYGGFCTYFGQDRARPDRFLSIGDAVAEPSFDESHIIAQFQRGAPPTPHTDCFNTLGTGYIRHARQTARLIVMEDWVDEVRYHPNVELITVNISNRDTLPEIIAGRFEAVLYA
jgi:hypothetical protein